MKLIDLIELLFKRVPVQFEPYPWNGPVPDHGVCISLYVPGEFGGWVGYYPYGDAEFVSPARTVRL